MCTFWGGEHPLAPLTLHVNFAHTFHDASPGLEAVTQGVDSLERKGELLRLEGYFERMANSCFVKK